ncbi:4-alpha-glucanotransferase [Vallitaleaceae bacterium 9-2]
MMETLKNPRQSGVLLHPTSFPGPFGIGDLGTSAYRFIDFLYASGQELWQILPLGPTGYGDSPYQAFSSYAGQPLLISIEKLMEEGLLAPSDIDYRDWDPHAIDFGAVIDYKHNLFKKAYDQFIANENTELFYAYKGFIHREKDWLSSYALFMAVKDAHDGQVWTSWDPEIAFPDKKAIKKWKSELEYTYNYYRFLQFIFFRQWFELKNYAEQKNVSIIGDIPIFVAFDSADVWANKELFYLDEKGFPTIVAGVPPDYFSATGQLWGNPLYHWKMHKKEHYAWWIKRIEYNLKFVDYLRIDHFRGFESYWAVPYGSPNAIHGEWQDGPGKDLFYAMEKALGKDLPIIAEDLGLITPAVRELRDAFNFPGMKILQFAFEDLGNNEFLPFNYTFNSIAYTGTHDNDTTLGWYQQASEASQDKVRRFMNTDANDICWDFIRTCFLSPSNQAVVPLQDILCLGSHARMNRPGIPAGNWQWRYTQDMLSDFVIHRLSQLSALSGRGQHNAILAESELD